MANRKIFPIKDASMYTLSQSMNTGLDEILEATTVLESSVNNTLPTQVSRYVLKFSQDEINTWVTSSVSGSVTGTTAGVMVLKDEYLVRPESYQRFETKGLSYPTSSRNKFDAIVEPLYSGSQNPNEPIYAGGSGTGLQLYLATAASYFKPGVSLSASIATSNAGGQPADNGCNMTAPDGNYGPFAFNRGATGNLEADTQGATVTLVVKNNRFEDAIVGTTALTSGAELFGSDAETGATPSYGESNAATMTVLAADLIAAGIQFESGGLVAGQSVLSIITGGAKTAMGGVFGPFEIDLSAAGVTVTGGTQQTGNGGAVTLQAGSGDLIVQDIFSVITTNPTNCGTGPFNGVTLTGTSSNDGRVDVTTVGNTIATATVTAGTGYNAGEVVGIAEGALGTGLFITGTGPVPTGGGTGYGNTVSSAAIPITAGMVTGAGEGGTIEFRTDINGDIVSTILTLGDSKNYQDGSIIEVPAATLQGSGGFLPGGAGNAVVTITTDFIQNSSAATFTLTAAQVDNNTLTVAAIPSLGSGNQYVEGNVITIPEAVLRDPNPDTGVARKFAGATGNLEITLGAANVTKDIANNDVYFNNGFGQLDDDWGVFPIVSLIAGYDPKLSRGKGYKFSDRLYIPSQSFHGSDDYYFELDKVNGTSGTQNFEPVEHKITMDNYAAVVTGLGMDQTLKVYPISGSWNMGTGKFANSPSTTDGVSWIFRNYSGSVAEGAEKWATSGAMTTSADQQIISTTVGTQVGSLTGIAGVGSRGGTGAQFTITTTGAQFTITTVTCTTGGTGYIPGDTITIPAATLTGGAIGTVTTDLKFKVTAVDGFGAYSEASWSGSLSGAGGNWYTGSNYGLNVVQEKIFNYGQGIDLDIDVTNTVKTWYTYSLGGGNLGFPNDGFLVKQSSSREFVNNKNFQSTFKYFSIDTNTIYPPALNLMWNDYCFATGSTNQSVLNTQESFVNIYNNAGTYYSESVPRLRISAIPKYPDVVFQTASLYTNNHYLPYTSSFYAIKDTDTNEYVVPFSDPYTKISADSISSYFDVEMAGLEPERYYTILIKSTVGGTVKVFDEDIMFKVING